MDANDPTLFDDADDPAAAGKGVALGFVLGVLFWLGVWLIVRAW